jgi:hypothetical protein
MIAVELPFMVAAFIPIVLVEAAILAKRLAIPFRRALLASARANGISTIVGVPLAWLGMALLQIVGADTLGPTSDTSLARVLGAVGGALWLYPEGAGNGWMIPTAVLALLVPTFFMSVWLEWRVLRRRLEDVDRTRVRNAVWIANVVSYSALFVLGVWLWSESIGPPR